MDIAYSETSALISDVAKNFAERQIKPHVMEWDEKQELPLSLFKEAGNLGFMGILVDEKYGGSALGYHEYVNIIEQIAIVDPSVGLSIAAHNSLCVSHINIFANEYQKQRWLPKLVSGECLGAWALTEPNSGSDAAGMNVKAIKEGDNWKINGTKTFITHGISADVYVVICRTSKPYTQHNATAFVIEKGTKGLNPGRKLDKLGMRASETTEVSFDNVIVSDDMRLGEVGEGFIQAMKVLDGGRISIAALSLGIAKGAYQASVKYAKEREQFGRKIGEFQAIGFKLADMLVKIEAAELLTHKAAGQINSGAGTTQCSAIAKLYASEVCVEIANEALQIHGGYGYIKGYSVEKFYRDAKLCTIGEGTSEIQKMVISRRILK